MKKRNCLEKKWLNDVFVQYNLQLSCNQLLNKRPETDPIVLDDIDPSSEWAESHPTELDVDFDIEAMELGGVDRNANLVIEQVVGGSEPPRPSITHGIGEGSNGRASWPTRASNFVKPSIVIDAREECEESLGSNPDDVYVALVDDPISSSGEEIDEWSCWSMICTEFEFVLCTFNRLVA